MHQTAIPVSSNRKSVVEIAVGDDVQWEHDGELMFQMPVRVVAVSNDGDHVYVAGRSEPLPIEEVTAVVKWPPPLAGGSADACVDTFMLKEGMVLIQYPPHLTAQSFEDLTDWLLLEHRKMARRVDSAVTPRLKKA